MKTEKKYVTMAMVIYTLLIGNAIMLFYGGIRFNENDLLVMALIMSNIAFSIKIIDKFNKLIEKIK